MFERMTLRYVIHDHIQRYEDEGWEIVSRLSYPHSIHAVLMRKVENVPDRRTRPDYTA